MSSSKLEAGCFDPAMGSLGVIGVSPRMSMSQSRFLGFFCVNRLRLSTDLARTCGFCRDSWSDFFFTLWCPGGSRKKARGCTAVVGRFLRSAWPNSGAGFFS